MATAFATYRHPVVTRATHSGFAFSFAGLALTGTQIELHKHWIPRAGLIHELFGVLMIVSVLAYIAHGLRSGGLRGIWFGESDIRGVAPMAAYYLRLRQDPPEYEGYNPLQKMAYTAAMLIITPLIIATGAALFFHVKAASVWHVGFAIELALFFAGHVFMAASTGLRRNLRAIVTGWYVSDELSPCRRPDSVLQPSLQTETPVRFDRAPQK